MFQKLKIGVKSKNWIERFAAAQHVCARFLRHDGGNIALLSSFILPALIALVGGTIDFASMTHQKTRLQAVADAAALSAAREMTVANTDIGALNAIVDTYVKHAAASFYNKAPVRVSTSVNSEQMTVQVSLLQAPTFYFYTALSQSVTQLGAIAKARVLGTTRICVLGLDTSAPGTVVLQSRARMTGTDCAVFSNSSSAGGVHAKNSSKLVASLTCSAGGYQGAESRFDPLPLVDCPRTDDPLADRPEPKVDESCDADKTELVLRNVVRTLKPGTYCDGLTITGSSIVYLEPGVYVLKNGPFRVSGSARLDGHNVGFFLTGNQSHFNFGRNTTIDLTAPEDGEMAGILFFESRSRIPTADHRITSNNARTLLGTIYLPKSDLVIDGSDVVADKSAYTVIIARKLKLFDGPHLVLNANYDQTDIPLPDDIINRGNHVGLVR